MKELRIFMVLCPRCKNKMKYSTRDTTLSKKYKKCVYCGKNLKVSDSVLRNAK